MNRTRFWLVFGIISLLSVPVSAQDRSRWEGYLRRLDRNGNGRIDTDEMSGRSRDWFKGLGLDTNRSISIDDIVKRQERQSRDRGRRGDDRSDSNFSNNIPGFSTTLPEQEKLQGFGFSNSNLNESGDSNRVGKNQYSADVIRQADDVLRRYDRNGDGILDQGEIRRTRFSNPPASESDKNKDGRLSREELLDRYKLRTSNWKQSGSNSNSNRFSRSRGNENQSRFGSRSSSSSNRSSSSSRSSRWSSRTSSGSSGRSFGSGSSGGGTDYPSYVRGIISKYDTDKDGLLSKTELGKMARAPKNVDKNKDGKVSYDELLAHYTGGSKSGSSSGSSGRRFGSSGSRFGGSSRAPISFSRDDKNRDGQIAMHEFAEKWDDETLAEFNKLDQNGDRFITKVEYEASKNQGKTSSSSSSSRFGSGRRRFGSDR